MAKKKSSSATLEIKGPDVDAAVSAALAEVEAKYGKGIACSGQEYLDKPRQVISLGPAFDLAMGGGIPSGKWVSVSGPEGTSKTGTMMSFIANAQKDKYGRRPCMVLDVECRLSEAILEGTRGLVKDKPMLTVIQSSRGCILSSSDFLNIGLTFLKTVPGGVLLIDSISALVNPKVIEGGLGTHDHGGGNKILGQFIDLAAPVVRAGDSLVLGVCQVYANTTGYGQPWNIKASKHWKHQADIAMHCKKADFIHADGDDQPATGQTQEWLITKCAFARPAAKVKSTIKYGVGIDRVGEMLELAMGFGLVTVNGSWVTFDFIKDKPSLWKGTEMDRGGEPKTQGKDKCALLLDSRSEWSDCLEECLAPYLAPDGDES